MMKEVIVLMLANNEASSTWLPCQILLFFTLFLYAVHERSFVADSEGDDSRI